MAIAQKQARLLQQVERQVARILERFVDSAAGSQGDFAKVEQAGRDAILSLRALLMSAGLQASLASAPQAYQCPVCHGRLSAYGKRERHVVTAEGEASVRSTRYRCLRCQEDHYPLEAANGLSDGHYTTGAKGLVAATASQVAYEPAAQVLAERGVSVSAKEVDRKVAEVSGWREAEERAAVGQLGATVRAGRLPTRRGQSQRQRQDAAAQPASAQPASAQPASAQPASAQPASAQPAPPLHTWSGWQAQMAAVISVDGGKVRSPVVGPQGLEWFEARVGVIAPVLAQPAPSPADLAHIDAAGAWPPAKQTGPTSRQATTPQATTPQATTRLGRYPRRPRPKRRPGRTGKSSSAPLVSARSRLKALLKAPTLYLAGPTDLAGPQEINALFRLMLAARQSDPHPGRLLLFIADGADWIWWRVGLLFPTARQVLDIYHAAEHVASAALACWGEGSPQAQHWRQHARTMLLAHGGPERIRQALRDELEHGQPVDANELRKNLAYLQEHKERMPYAELYAKGLPVGSGVMESAVKQLSTQRLRQPGMMWTKQGAARMLRLRAAQLSGNLKHTVAREHARLQASTQAYALTG